MPPKKGKKEEAPPAPSEFDSLSLAQLKETVLKLRDETSKLAADRNQVATDRVCISLDRARVMCLRCANRELGGSAW